MAKINTVAVLGAGAVGAYFIQGLEEKLGERLWTVAQGERGARLKKEGLLINGRRYSLHVRTPGEARGADLLLVAVKYGALRDSLADIEAVADSHTIVMSLLNGVDSEEIIGERIGGEHMLYSFMKIASERQGGSVVLHSGDLLWRGRLPGTHGKNDGRERPTGRNQYSLSYVPGYRKRYVA